MFSEECKYIVTEKKMPDYITNEMEISSDDFDREDSDKENFDEENFNEENQTQNVFIFIFKVFWVNSCYS